jgi:hypothetical protein
MKTNATYFTIRIIIIAMLLVRAFLLPGQQAQYGSKHEKNNSFKTYHLKIKFK